MNSASRIALAFGFAAVAGLSLYLLAPDHVPSAAGKAPEAARPVETAPAPAIPMTGGQGKVEVQERKLAGDDWKQGVQGRVLAPGGVPCAEAEVFLLPSASASAIETFLKKQKGEVVPPAGSGRTGADGRFRLGCAASERPLDLCVVSAGFPELYYRSLRIAPEEWVETGDLMLTAGVVVQGQVVQEGTLVPVAEAQVFLQSTNAMYSLLAAPGRERGLPAVTDRSGFFRYTAAPRDTTVTLTAEAKGFAKVTRLNLALQPDAVNEFRLELPVGLSIAGLVHDRNGNPIAGVDITATAISNKVPQQGQAKSAADGRFELAGLREGPYRLAAIAARFEAKQEPCVFAGDEQVDLVLGDSGAARVRVLGRNGRAIQDFTLSLKRWFPDQAQIGNVIEFRDRRITPRDFDGDTALVAGLPNGQYVFQVAAADHARTLSAPFIVLAGGDVPVVVVQMTLGGTIVGRVVDERGTPVAGATVSTCLNGSAGIMDSPLWDFVEQVMRDRITQAKAATDARGRFRLQQLGYGDYMLRVVHPDFCEGAAADLKIADDGEIDAGELALARGALVHGTCSVAGRPAGQVKVLVAPPDGAALSSRSFTANAVSDGEGGYRLLKRVPPGTWQICAFREGGQGDIFAQLMDRRQTARELVILPGQAQSQQDFQLAAR